MLSSCTSGCQYACLRELHEGTDVREGDSSPLPISCASVWGNRTVSFLLLLLLGGILNPSAS